MKIETRGAPGRGVAAFLIGMAALMSLSSPALADKLVIFKNGKAMRVKSAVPNGKWLKCELDDKNFISVHESTILVIEEAALGGSAGEHRTNQVATGTGGGYVPSAGGGDVGPAPDSPVADLETENEELVRDAVEDQTYQRQKLMEAAAARRGNARGSGLRGQNLQNPAAAQQGVGGVPGGFQPLTQPGTLPGNRRLSPRRGAPGDALPQGARPPAQADE
ncbi:MAG TPA: hypothetical protein VGK94_10725 [Candidatus Polarisedimenticolia bacterium]|jgi:hypothetical protein